MVEHLSIRDERSCEAAAAALAAGAAVGSYIRGVCGIWVDGRNDSAIETGYRIKGAGRGHRPFGVILSADSVSEAVDVDRVSPATRSLLLDPSQLAARLGSMCFIRYPIRRSIASSLPSSVYSVDGDGLPILQSWLPEGCRTTDAWMSALQRHGIDLPIATSMNISGTPELIRERDGIEFCDRNGIPYFLGDPDSPGIARGSFPILSVAHSGIALIREGHFPGRLFDRLLDEWDVDRHEAGQAAYPVVETHSEAEAAALSPEELRREIIATLDGDD